LYITTWLISTTLYVDGTCSEFISGSKVLHQILYTIVQSLMLSVKVPCQLHTKNLSYQDDIWSVIACTQLNQNYRISSLHSWQIWKKMLKKNLEDMYECKYFFPSFFFGWESEVQCTLELFIHVHVPNWHGRIVMHFFNQNCNALFFTRIVMQFFLTKIVMQFFFTSIVMHFLTRIVMQFF